MTEDTHLLRQINPSWIQQGRITSQVFKPTPKDQKKLSAYDGDIITPENAWKHYTEILEFKSVGVMAVAVSDCIACHLSYFSDPVPFPEHVIIDFSGFSTTQIESKAKYLKRMAESRGWLYRSCDSQ
jgi:hypothetical protein